MSLYFTCKQKANTLCHFKFPRACNSAKMTFKETIQEEAIYRTIELSVCWFSSKLLLMFTICFRFSQTHPLLFVVLLFMFHLILQAFRWQNASSFFLCLNMVSFISMFVLYFARQIQIHLLSHTYLPYHQLYLLLVTFSSLFYLRSFFFNSCGMLLW